MVGFGVRKRSAEKRMAKSSLKDSSQEEGLLSLTSFLLEIKRRPGMFFGRPPYLHSLEQFLYGYESAESIHRVEKREIPPNGSNRLFVSWLIRTKNLSGQCTGWSGMIESVEGDEERQLQLAIDYFIEFLRNEES